LHSRTAITSLNLTTTSSKGFIGTSIRDEITPLLSQTTVSTTGSAAPTGSLPEQLWNKAYDELKKDHGELLLRYETILSQELNGVDWNTVSKSQLVGTMIEEENPVERMSQMTRLIQAGLKKTETEAEMKERAGEAIQVVLSAKKMIDSIIEKVPPAALAWTGVCLGLQVSLLVGTENIDTNLSGDISKPYQ
jgi:NWD NACHT NTPase-like protein